MSDTSRERILQMVSDGKLTTSDADELLRAMQTPRRPLWTWLIFPFERLGTGPSLAVAAVMAVVGIVLSRLLLLRFDGALDLHLAGASPAWPTVVIDAVVAWPLTALVFWGASRIASRGGRFIDFLGAVGVARLPLLLTVPMTLALRNEVAAALQGQVSVRLIALSLASLPLVAWMIALLVTGFRAASGLRDGRLAVTFVLALIVAEALSKLVLAVAT